MGTRRLTLLRHGQAQPIDSCPEDFERTLTHRGTIEATEMASRLVRRNWIPELILVSPAERTWSTASIVAKTCELEPKQVQCARELYLAAPETIWRLLRRRDSELLHILVCGHNPGLSQMASRFGPKPEAVDLPTAGIATAIWQAGTWETIEAEMASSRELDDPENMTNLWT